MQISLLDGIEIILCATLVLLAILNTIKLPSILGYLILGVAVGPLGLGVIKDTHITAELAEIGVVLLLFTIGLEFSLPKLLSLRRFVFLYGGLQVSLTLLLTTLAAQALSIPLSQAIIIGAVSSMSSTAIVSKLLKEQDELDLPHGQRAIGILLFQDLAVIPLMILIPSLEAADLNSIFSELIWAISKGVTAIAAIIVVGNLGLKPLFNRIAKTRSLELFTLTILVVTLSAAWITNRFGLSFALGAFLAGMMLGETEFRHQIATDIRPFRDILLGLFFISIGFLIDLNSIILYWPWILLFLLALIGLKFIIIFLLCWHGKQDKVMVASQSALVLAQGGEFGLVLLSLAIGKGLLPQDYGQVILVSTFLSMLITPILIRNNLVIMQKIFGGRSYLTDLLPDINISEKLNGHVIILGFGRVGQNVANIVTKQAIPFIALDLEVDRVKVAYKAGENVYYGDASQGEILEACHIRSAKSVVISFYHPSQSTVIIQQIRKISQSIPIIARCYDEVDADKLYDLGVNEVIPESVEASLMLAFHLLLRVNVPLKKAWDTIEGIRKNHYAAINYLFPDSEEIDEHQELITALEVSSSCYLNGKSLGELIELCKPAIIVRLKRGAHRLDLNQKNQSIQPGDVLVLHALPGLIEELRDRFQLI